MIARQKHPMGPNSLDALCKRYGVDNTRRTKHGALLDSELLADVYLELIGGRQQALGLASVASRRPAQAARQLAVGQRPHPLPERISAAEQEAHRRFVEGLGPNALWLKQD
jgi:DNA polymerase-3 subunit epsilon